MTIEAWQGPLRYTIMGRGPYAVSWPYVAGGLVLHVVAPGGARAILAPIDWAVAPAASEAGGNITLSAAAAALHDRAQLVIYRATPVEQGWQGLLGEREAGMETQLDELTMAIQEAARAAGSALRFDGPVPPMPLVPGRSVVIDDGGLPAAGPSLAEISAAAGHAAAAKAARDATIMAAGNNPRDGSYSVRAFGAKGDGLTLDDAAFQAAVDWVGDGVLVVPPGTYLLSNILVTKGTLIVCQGGASQVTASAPGTQGTRVSFRYAGAGGAGSRLFTFCAQAANEWIKGGGIIGRPHLSGENRCELLIDARSMHGASFDVELSRATFAGMSLNGLNGVLSQFCTVDMKYIWGAQPATENSHGLILNGVSPDQLGWVGCTQNRVWTNGATKHGDMVRMVGHCDNNHLWIHGTQGLGANKGAGRSLAIMHGPDGTAGRINHVHYCCGSIFLQANSFGTHFDFLTSEGMSITGSGQYSVTRLLDYVTGKAYTTKAAPLTEYIFVGAAEMMPTGAAVKQLPSGTGTPVIRLPKSGDAGAAISLHDPNWGSGIITGLELIYRSSGSGNVWLQGVVTSFAEGQGLAPDQTYSEAMPVTAASNIQKHMKALAIPTATYGMVAAHVQRLPTGGSDTFAGDLELLGVRLRIDFDGPPSLTAPVPAWREKA